MRVQFRELVAIANVMSSVQRVYRRQVECTHTEDHVPIITSD
jgi:hypothetical protein